LLLFISRYRERPATMDLVIEVIAKAASDSSATSLIDLSSSLSEMVVPSKNEAHSKPTAHEEIVDAKWMSDCLMHRSFLLVDHWTKIGTQSQDLDSIANVVLFLSGLIGVGVTPDDPFTQCWERIVYVSQQLLLRWASLLFRPFQTNGVSRAIQIPAHLLLIDDLPSRVHICLKEVQKWSGKW
jgi:hypothetical protein